MTPSHCAVYISNHLVVLYIQLWLLRPPSKFNVWYILEKSSFWLFAIVAFLCSHILLSLLSRIQAKTSKSQPSTFSRCWPPAFLLPFHSLRVTFMFEWVWLEYGFFLCRLSVEPPWVSHVCIECQDAYYCLVSCPFFKYTSFVIYIFLPSTSGFCC